MDGKEIVFNGKPYRLEETEEEYVLIDLSNSDYKFDLSFSKDPKDHEIAREGLRMFWTEVYS